MKLFDAPWAPSPRRGRIFIAEKGIAIDLRTGGHLKPPYSDLNPRGQVPALLLDDSVAIRRYLEGLRPEPSLFGRNPIARPAVGRRLIARWPKGGVLDRGAGAAAAAG